ncbi:CHAT domain-containing protein [Nodosilinea sp. LEGE 07088]|uniref:CHAT domain-containing protein n=1 Tax=Nodosilinea sp. LEGE 07088 TaxID=2777968 RepID=UPI0028BDF746|nr:CHAT domain-containing protein [Nodosilinea sp. LEGE 07088]
MEKIKILILSANPKDTDRLRLGQEKREIEEALELAQKRDRFEIVSKDAVRVDDLRRALLKYSPQIVHFSGHGAGTNGIVLENDAGNMDFVSTDALSGLFRLFRDTLQCVFLNACYSEIQAEAIHQHINYVVGMNKTIGDRAAIQFAKGFYDALGAGRPIEFAFDMGCAAINLASIPESLTPVMKKRPDISDSFLLDPLYDEDLGDDGTNTSSKESNSMETERASQSIIFSGGTNTGQIAQAGGDVNQTQYQTQTEPEKQLTSAQVLALLTELENLVGTSPLSVDEKEEAMTHLKVAKSTASKEKPDKNYVATSLKHATEVLKQADEVVGTSQGLWSKAKPIISSLLPWLGAVSHIVGL